MQGYYGRDEASRGGHLDRSAGTRWLRTGDLGQLDEEGFLYIVDRKKDMILSGSQNVYPADIEQVMRGASGRGGRRGGRRTQPQMGRDTGCGRGAEERTVRPRRPALLEWTNSRVGKQQRITDVVWRDSLPRNANGKVLKRELRAELAASEY